MYGLKTSKRLYEVVTRLCTNQVHLTMAGYVGLGHQKLEYLSSAFLQKSMQYIEGVENGYLIAVKEREVYALGISASEPRKAVYHGDFGAVKSVERDFLDLLSPMKHFHVGKTRYLVTVLDFSSSYSLMLFVVWKKEADDAVIEMVLDLENLVSTNLHCLSSINRYMPK